MRAVRIPAFVLAAVLAYILCSAAWVTAESRRWLDGAAQVSDAALRGSAGEAAQALDALEARWQAHQGYLHLVVSHTELDEAEALLAQARAAARQGDMGTLHLIMAELHSRFETTAQTQQVHFRNIF